MEQQNQVTGGVTHAREIVVVATSGNPQNCAGNSTNDNVVPSAFLAKGLNVPKFKRDSKNFRTARFCYHRQRSGHSID